MSFCYTITNLLQESLMISSPDSMSSPSSTCNVGCMSVSPEALQSLHEGAAYLLNISSVILNCMCDLDFVYNNIFNSFLFLFVFFHFKVCLLKSEMNTAFTNSSSFASHGVQSILETEALKPSAHNRQSVSEAKNEWVCKNGRMKKGIPRLHFFVEKMSSLF